MTALATGNDSRADSGGAPASEIRVLLVEDSPLLQARLSDLLEKPGVHRVRQVADSAVDAQTALDAEAFDVLVVDVQLRQGTGIEVVRHARQRYSGGRQPLIIVLTNYAIPTVEARCREAGADHFLDKIRQFERIVPLIAEWRSAHAR